MKKKTLFTEADKVGFEANLWAAAGHKHVVLGLTFLKYISDAFDARHAELDARIAHGNTFHNDRQCDLKVDYVLPNPPINDSDWRGDMLEDDPRWVYGTPPAGNDVSDAISVHQRQAA